MPVLSSNWRAILIKRGLSEAAMIIMSKMSGNAAKSSPVRIMAASTLPPRYPDNNPNVMPMSNPPVTIEMSVMMTVG